MEKIIINKENIQEIINKYFFDDEFYKSDKFNDYDFNKKLEIIREDLQNNHEIYSDEESFYKQTLTEYRFYLFKDNIFFIEDWHNEYDRGINEISIITKQEFKKFIEKNIFEKTQYLQKVLEKVN